MTSTPPPAEPVLRLRPWHRLSVRVGLNIARTGALFVDPRQHAEVERTRTRDSAAYRQRRALLASVQDENRVETPIYTLTDFDGRARQARFMVTSRGPGAPDEPYPLVPALVEPGAARLR